LQLGVDKHACFEIAGWGQALDPLQHQLRNVLEPAGANKAMNGAYALARITPDRNSDSS